jgi:hypothetical protein
MGPAYSAQSEYVVLTTPFYYRPCYIETAIYYIKTAIYYIEIAIYYIEKANYYIKTAKPIIVICL